MLTGVGRGLHVYMLGFASMLCACICYMWLGPHVYVAFTLYTGICAMPYRARAVSQRPLCLHVSVCVDDTCPPCMSPLYVPPLCPPSMSPLYVPPVSLPLCPPSMSPLHVPPVCMHMYAASQRPPTWSIPWAVVTRTGWCVRGERGGGCSPRTSK